MWIIVLYHFSKGKHTPFNWFRGKIWDYCIIIILLCIFDKIIYNFNLILNLWFTFVDHAQNKIEFSILQDTHKTTMLLEHIK
jgi:hypothetical protein